MPETSRDINIMFSYLNRAVSVSFWKDLHIKIKISAYFKIMIIFLFLQRSDGGGVFDIQDRINGLALCGCSTLAACQVLCCFIYKFIIHILYFWGLCIYNLVDAVHVKQMRFWSFVSMYQSNFWLVIWNIGWSAVPASRILQLFEN